MTMVGETARSSTGRKLSGKRYVIDCKSRDFPDVLRRVKPVPKQLYVVGDPGSMVEGLAIIGARKATPYGFGAAKRFGALAAEHGITVISGGARGCDCASQRAAIDAGGKSVAFLASIDDVYPRQNFNLFQEIINTGGCCVSEWEWEYPCLPQNFRLRNRLIAGLAKATLIVEAGIPSGTFSTADDALAANREVLVIPGAITSKESAGANRLLYQGATPIIDDETFLDQLSAIFGILQNKRCPQVSSASMQTSQDRILLQALNASKLKIDDLFEISKNICGEVEPLPWLMLWLANARANNLVALYPDGSYGPLIREK